MLHTGTGWKNDAIFILDFRLQQADVASHFNLETLKDLPGLDDLKAAGLLDARPTLSHLPRESDEGSTPDVPDEDNEFATWGRDDTDPDADRATAAIAKPE